MKTVPINVKTNEKFIIWSGQDAGKILTFSRYRADQYDGKNGNPEFKYREQLIYPLWKNVRRLNIYTFAAMKIVRWKNKIIPCMDRYIFGSI